MDKRWKPEITKEEFEKAYCGSSGISLKEYRKYRVTMPCVCDYEGCQGWAAILNDPYLIEHQKEFHSPDD